MGGETVRQERSAGGPPRDAEHDRRSAFRRSRRPAATALGMVAASLLLASGIQLLDQRVLDPETSDDSRRESLGGAAFVSTAVPPVDGFGPTWGRPFTDGSAWNRPIPSSPVLDSNSRAIADYLGGQAAVANLEQHGVPVYNANANTPRYEVPCVSWSGCDLEKQPVPIPDNARPAPGGDAQMVVIDWSTRTAYELYRAQKHSDGSWTAGWGGVISVDGDGYKGDSPHLPTGAGVSRLAGVVRTFEVAQGQINHALVFSTDNACTRVHRYPAAKTDGLSSRSDCIPQGARVQLDPSIDVDRLPNATPAEKMVAKALQTYGAYAMDTGGARIALIFQPPYGRPDPYPDAGLTEDYQPLSNIPWDRLRVLRQWDGR